MTRDVTINTAGNRGSTIAVADKEVFIRTLAGMSTVFLISLDAVSTKDANHSGRSFRFLNGNVVSEVVETMR